jgi:hypothetical protein
MGNQVGRKKNKAPKEFHARMDNFIKHNLLMYNWMEEMSDNIKKIKLKDLRLIKSHQSATYSIKSILMENVSICQDSSIYYQLYGGVRVLDFRPAIYKDKEGITCGHGPHSGISLIKCFEEIKMFLNKFQKEFVIVEMELGWNFLGTGRNLNYEEKLQLLTMIKDTFSTQLITNKDTWFSFSDSTLEDIWKHKKQILFLSELFTRNCEIIIKEEETSSFGVWDLRTRLFGKWPDTNDREVMQSRINKQIELAHLEDNNSKLFSCYAQLTPQILESVFDLSCKLHQDRFLDNWLDKNLNKRLNIIGFDFCFNSPSFVRKIIYSNLKQCRTDNMITMKITSEDNHFTFQVFDREIITIYHNNSLSKNILLCQDLLMNKEYLHVNKLGKVLFSDTTKDFSNKTRVKNFFQIHFVESEGKNSKIRIKSCYYSSKLGKEMFVYYDTENNEFVLREENFTLFKFIYNNQFSKLTLLYDNGFSLSRNENKLTLQTFNPTIEDRNHFFIDI